MTEIETSAEALDRLFRLAAAQHGEAYGEAAVVASELLREIDDGNVVALIRFVAAAGGAAGFLVAGLANADGTDVLDAIESLKQGILENVAALAPPDAE